MSTITATDQAFGTFAGVKNVPQRISANAKPRKVLIVGSGDPSKDFVENDPVIVTSDNDVGAKTGFGFSLHRIAKYFYANSGGIETWIINQPEDGSAVAATGDITFVGTITTAGTIYLYIANELISFGVSVDDDATAIGDACEAAINAFVDCPLTASNTAGVVALTAKSKGTYGNFVDISFNLESDQEFPAGLTSATVTDMSGGATDPDIQDALDALGTGDAQNEQDFTEIIYAYEASSTLLNKLSTWNGEGNTYVGNYSQVIGRPIRTLYADTTAGSGGYSALIAIADGRKSDRTNGVVAVPGSISHPQEISAAALGQMTTISAINPAQNYLDVALRGIRPGAVADRWTDTYANRSTAVNKGISPTLVKSGAVVLQNVCTFFHPDDLPLANNSFLSQRNIALKQNVLYSTLQRFDVDKWKGISIVTDATRVADPTASQKVRDIQMVISEFSGLYRDWYNLSWLFDDGYSIQKLKESGNVSIRDSAFSGFDVRSQIIYSKEGGLFNVNIEDDVSIAVLAS